MTLSKPGTRITQNSMLWPILMGIEHEKIHLETSAVIMAQLPLSFINLEYAQREFPYSDSSYRQH